MKKAISLLVSLGLFGCGTSELEGRILLLQQENQSLRTRLYQKQEENLQLNRALKEAEKVRVPTGISAVVAARGESRVPTNAQSASAYQQAYQSYQAGDNQAAIAGFERVLAQQEGSEEELRLSLYWLGNAYYQQREYELASRFFAGFLRLVPHGERSERALDRLSSSLLELGRIEEATLLREQGVQVLY